jgi:hypothetical protein
VAHAPATDSLTEGSHGERFFSPRAFHPHKPTTNSDSEFVVATTMRAGRGKQRPYTPVA